MDPDLDQGLDRISKGTLVRAVGTQLSTKGLFLENGEDNGCQQVSVPFHRRCDLQTRYFEGVFHLGCVARTVRVSDECLTTVIARVV